MNWLKDGESAYIVNPDDTDLLAKTIVDAFRDSEKRKSIGRKGQELCRESFDYKKNGKQLVLFFYQLYQQAIQFDIYIQ